MIYGALLYTGPNQNRTSLRFSKANLGVENMSRKMMEGEAKELVADKFLDCFS